MKKLIFILLLTILLSGCGNDQYAIEKRYWKMQKQAEKIFKNPAASPPHELERVVNLLNGFVKKFPGNRLSLESEFNIARLYIVKEEYDKARAQLKTLLDKYNKSQAICSEAVFMIGNSYEIEDKWNSALGQYKKIMQEYATTLRGISVPIYIAQHYKIKYQPEKMIAAFQDAIEHYQALAGKYPDSPLAYQADKLVAECYLALKDWQNAISTFNTMIEKFKGKVDPGEALLSIALIYKKELKDDVRSKQALEQLIKDYPKSRFFKTAEALLKGVNKK
jgi:TolA-binding protein